MTLELFHNLIAVPRLPVQQLQYMQAQQVSNIRVVAICARQSLSGYIGKRIYLKIEEFEDQENRRS